MKFRAEKSATSGWLVALGETCLIWFNQYGHMTGYGGDPDEFIQIQDLFGDSTLRLAVRGASVHAKRALGATRLGNRVSDTRMRFCIEVAAYLNSYDFGGAA